MRTTSTSSHDRHAARQTLRQARTTLEVYDAEIQRRLDALKGLVEERNKAIRVIEECQQRLATIHSLPPEVMLNVFSLSCCENWLDPKNICPSIALSAVCATWRDIILSTPSLWTSIGVTFTYPSWPLELLPLLRHQIQLFTVRSHTALLSVSLVFDSVNTHTPSSGGHRFPDMKSAWNILASSSHRWHNLSVHVDKNSFLSKPFFRLIAGRLDSLKHLSLTADLEARVAVDMDLFEVCPSLDTVVLSYLCPELLILPYSQIYCLTIQNCTIGEDFVSLFPNVERLVLEDTNSPYEPDEPERQLYCSSKVRSLSIVAGFNWDDEEECNFFNVFRTFTLGGLSSLEIADFKSNKLEGWDTFDDVAVIGFLSRSNCSITHFVLKWTPISDVQAVGLVRLMPALRSLHIEEYHYRLDGVPTNSVITRKFLEAFTLDTRDDTEQTGFLAPSLRKLTLVLHRRGLDRQALANMLISRRPPGYSYDAQVEDNDHLSSVVIGFIGPGEVDTAIIRCFDEIGLQPRSFNISMERVPHSSEVWGTPTIPSEMTG
ncbi:hypothetical protein VNI00_010574 [Paramarasmius palmivorus]|uniref:F-box domain-containing protein n=1 Tax=Paramarasmius palmivorus TaxID=297713 RepID=A0AAW0CIC1_9AGAR